MPCYGIRFNGRSGKLCGASRPCGSDPNYKRYKGGKGLCRLHILMEFFRFSMGEGLFKFSYREYCQGIFAFFSFCNDVGGIGMIPFERGTDCSYRFL